jgi:hypothetical protein
MYISRKPCILPVKMILRGINRKPSCLKSDEKYETIGLHDNFNDYRYGVPKAV